MESNFQKLIFSELEEFLRPLLEVEDDPDQLLRILKVCGWDAETALGNDLNKVVSAITTVAKAIDRIRECINNPPQSIPDLITMLGNAAPMFSGIKNLAEGNFIQNSAATPRIGEIPTDIVQWLLARYLYVKSPFLYKLFELAGIITEKQGDAIVMNGIVVQHVRRAKQFQFDQLGSFLANPTEQLKKLYWPNGFPNQDETTLVARRFFPPLSELLSTVGITSFVGRGIGPATLPQDVEKTFEGMMSLKFAYFDPNTNTSGNLTLGIGILPEDQGGPGVFVTPAGSLSFGLPIGNWVIDAKAEGQIDGFQVSRNGIEIYQGTGNLTQFKFDTALTKNTRDDVKALLIGSIDATRFEIGQISVGGGVALNSSQKEYKVYADLKECAIIIKAGEGDSFLGKLMGDGGISATFDIRMNWSNVAGFHIEGSGGLEISLPFHLQLGPIDIQGLIVSLGIKGRDVPIELSTTIKGDLGPVQFIVENIGLRAKIAFPEDGKGKLGSADFVMGFKPPNGVGVSINAGAVIGGGYLFFDFEKEEYAGVVELTIAGFISAKAIGLITTRMPDGSKGFSMLLIITVEFFPPYQLGYGFTLMAVGGLVGLNRTVLLDPLREGVRTGAVSSIMFPQDVIKNAQKIISDLKAIFPPYEGKFLIGPMGKLGYGTPTLVSLSLGLIIEIPGNFAILGILKIALPDEKAALVQIQVAFVGTIDFDKKMLTFDASIFDSFILIFTLEGDIAVRLKWGDHPNFLMSVGGFHPSFTPPPLALPAMRRLAITILNTSIAKIRVECYQAITSNSVQFGAKAEMFIDVKVCSIEGYIAFDALFQFSPFYFIISLAAGFALKIGGSDVLSIRIKMSLEGPTPWRAKGSGSISILFFDISADFDKTWGDEANTSLPDIHIVPRLLEEMNKKENWSARLPEGRSVLVSLRKFKETENAGIVLHPSGDLVVHQKLLPFTVLIDKVGSQKPDDLRKVQVSSARCDQEVLNIANVDEDFARAQYQKMSDAEKLSKPSFERMPGGVAISKATGAIANGKMVRKKIAYECTIIDKEPTPSPTVKIPRGLFNKFILGNSAALSALSNSRKVKMQPFESKITTVQDAYVVTGVADNKNVNGNSTFSSQAAAETHMKERVASNPSLSKSLQVVLEHESQNA